MNDKQPTPGELVGIGAGVVLLIGSFLPFYSFDISSGIPGLGVSKDWSAWSNDFNLFPIATLVVLLGVATAARLAVTRLGTAPDAPWMRWGGYDLVLSVLAAVTMLGYVLRDVSADTGIGAWLMLLGTIALVVSAALRGREATV